MDQDNTLNSKLSFAEEKILQCPKCMSFYASNISYCTSDGTKLEKSDVGTASSKLFADKYEILDEIGSGGMGTVYRVKQILLDKICALKVITTDTLNDVLIARFQREAKLMATLDHYNLARIFDFGVFKNQPFMVMEYIDGIPLNKMIADGTLKLEDCIDIFGQILDALAHAHKMGVLHRDIKPSNIMITPAGGFSLNATAEKGHKATLLDFGIAKKFDTSDDPEFDNVKTQALTRTGEMVGSPVYMSPEQARGERLTERSDLYSLGCALFESLTGTPPLMGRSTVDTLVLHMDKTAPTLKEASLGKEFPPGIERVVQRLLAKNPDDRYQSAEETKKALALALQLDEQSVDYKVVPTERTIPRAALILLSAATVVTLSVVAFLTIQGEKENTKNKSLLDSEKFKLEQTLMQVADKAMIDNPPANQKLMRDESDDVHTSPENPAQIENQVKYQFISGMENALILGGQSLEEQRVERIQSNKRLLDLGLAQSKFPHEMIGNLSGHLLRLRLSGTHFTDEDMKYVAKNIHLQELFLNNNPITAKGLRYLAGLHSLRTLDIGRTRCDAAAIAELRKLPNLKTLHAYNNPYLENKAAKEVSALVKLEQINLTLTKITGEGISHMHHLQHLTLLNLDKNRLTDDDIRTVGQIKNLQELHLSKNNITSAGIKYLVPLKHLNYLELDDNPIEDKATEYFVKMKNVDHLSLTGSNFTKEGVMKLAPMPSLGELYIRRIAGANEIFAHNFLTACKSCREIIYLNSKNSAYDRKEWRYDEKNKSNYLPQQDQESGR